MSVLNKLQPEGVFAIFEQLCAIPHGSRNTKAISDFCVKFAEQRGLRYIQDENNNVIIFAPASAGMEHAQPVILQGHLDMVCEKTPDCDLDMEKQGLRLQTDGEWVWADQTTLGGDDGIAVAYALASIQHPPLEVILTVDEEIGMLGAASIDLGQIGGRRLLNIDSEEEGVLLTSCAGGATVSCSIPMMWSVKKGLRVTVKIHGLRGGHSGTEIDKGRANANVLLGRFLNELDKEYPYALCTVDGGLKDNAIPRESTADMIISPDYLEELCAYAAKTQNAWREEFGENDPEIAVSVQEIGIDSHEVMFGDCRRNTLAVMSQLPNGVQAMSQEIEGLVQTSLNLGILKTDFRGVHMTFSVRSSINAEKDALMEQLADLMARYGGGAEINGEYPAWEYRKESKLRRIMTQVYTEQYGEAPKIQAIHAGLECGLLAGKLPDLDAISFGPDIEEIHTTRERLSIPSVQRTWNFILGVLKACK